MNVEELEARIRTLENQIRTLQDIEEIKKLQRAYGFYIEHMMSDELVDLFSDRPDATLLIALGEFRGKESIKRFFHNGTTKEESDKQRRFNPYFLHQVMQLSGVVDVDPDGERAKGRWYGFGANTMPTTSGRVRSGWMNGIYEVEYIKEDGKWKILKIHWCMRLNARAMGSWVDPSKRAESTEQPYRPHPLNPDGEGERRGLYPSVFVLPFHYKHPVTGK